MIGFIIICFVIPIILSVISYSQDDDLETAGAVLISSFFIIGAVYLGICACFETQLGIPELYEEKQYNISGLENKTTQEFEMNGKYITAFTIGYGSVSAETETEMNYWFFKETEYGKKLESIPCDDVWIRETDNGEYGLIHVMEKRIMKGNPILSKIFITISDEDYSYTEFKEKILQVPVGTVQVEYNVDF